MAKTRVPRLPTGANRATYQAFVQEVKRYARSEFQRGATEQNVYASVNQAGVPLPALRSAIGREYLAFIGVTDANLKAVRFIAMLSAFVFYAFVTSRVATVAPFFRYGVPACFAIVVFVGVEYLGQQYFRARKRPKK